MHSLTQKLDLYSCRCSLWDIVGEGDVTEIAQLASDHFRRTGRPLRIAVDEAGWRFHNLNEHQVKGILKETPNANPVERLLFYRITKILGLNVQLIFIFDGPKRPWKRGGPAGRVDYSKINVLRKLLDRLRVPHHRAPAEAEAECARLQQEGIVDAVWSEDSDTLMFGCTLLFRTHKVPKEGGKGQKKDESRVRVHRAHEILQKHQLDREGMVLFAMLAGGDYNRQGLKGCGPTLALKAVKKGYGKRLCESPNSRLPHFRFDMLDFFKNKDVEIPADWPRPLHLKHYNDPVTSSREQLHSLRGLRNGWDVEIDQAMLRQFLIEEVQLSTKDFLRHVCPLLLVRKLSRGAVIDEGVATSVPFGVELVNSRRKVNADGSHQRLERKIRFLPRDLVSFDLMVRPEGEDWAKLATKAKGDFDPNAKIECGILETILRHGLPASFFEAPPSPKRSSKRRERVEQPEELHQTEAP
ncbi:PIN domain-like protein, partial [Phyllosticta citribraziliensis]